MKKLFFTLSLFWMAFLSQAQPISGIADKNYFPKDQGRYFSNEYKLYQTHTQFFESKGNGFHTKIQEWLNIGGGTSFQNQQPDPVIKNLNSQALIYTDENLIFRRDKSLFEFLSGVKGCVKTETGNFIYPQFNHYGGVGPDSVYLYETTDTTTRNGLFAKGRFQVTPKNIAGKSVMGAHDTGGPFQYFWISSDPEFVGKEEKTALVRMNKSIDRRVDKVMLLENRSIQKSVLLPNGTLQTVCAFYNAGLQRALKLLRWNADLALQSDSFTVPNSIGFTVLHSMTVDAQNRILLAFETRNAGQYMANIVRLLPNGNPDPGFAVVQVSNSLPLWTHSHQNLLVVSRQINDRIVVNRYSTEGVSVGSQTFGFADNHLSFRPVFSYDNGSKIIFEQVEPIFRAINIPYPFGGTYDSTFSSTNRFILDLVKDSRPLIDDLTVTPALLHPGFGNSSLLSYSHIRKRMVLQGNFSHVQGKFRPRITTLFPNGLVDTNFFDASRWDVAARDTFFHQGNIAPMATLLAGNKTLLWSRISFNTYLSNRLNADGSLDPTYPRTDSYIQVFESPQGGFYALSLTDSLGNRLTNQTKQYYSISRLDSFANLIEKNTQITLSNFSQDAQYLWPTIKVEDSQKGIWLTLNVNRNSFGQPESREIYIARLFNGKLKIRRAPKNAVLFDPVSITVLPGNRFQFIGNCDTAAVELGLNSSKSFAHTMTLDSNLALVTDGTAPAHKVYTYKNANSYNNSIYIMAVQKDRKLICGNSLYPFIIFRLLSDGRYDPSFVPITSLSVPISRDEMLIQNNRLFFPSYNINYMSYNGFTGYHNFPGSSRKFGLHSFLLNSSLQPENFAQGRVVQVPNTDNTCNPNPTAKGLGMKMMESTPSGRITFTDTSGFYTLVLPQGQHSIKQVIQGHELQRQTCPLPSTPEHSVSFGGTGLLEVDKDFKNQTYNCTKLGVGVFTGRNRLCSKRTYNLTYSNDGITAEPNARIKLKLPMHVSIFSASKPYTYSADSSLIFAIGNLGAGQTGKITIVDSVHCINGLDGTEQGCLSARIEPLQLCGAVTPSSINWDGAWLDAKATSINNDGEVRFVIYSKGSSMSDSTKYRLEHGNTIKVGKVKLVAGDSLVLISQANGFYPTYLILDQPNNCPAGKTSTIAHNGKKDAVTYLSFEDGWFQFQNHTFCDVYRFSYDPNEKQVEPKVDIDPGNQLTYTIHFENFGNDTAYAVAIADTFSAGLDFRSFRFLESSHPCTPLIDQKGDLNIINFLFNPIKLTAKKQDSVASKGYVRFTMQSKPALLPGDEIKNTAHIYFDRNPAIVTNTVVSRIYTPSTPTGVRNPKGKRSLELYPNPAQKTVWLLLPDAQKSDVVKIFDTRGVMIMETFWQSGELNIQSLKPGVYVVKVGSVAPARLIVTH